MKSFFLGLIWLYQWTVGPVIGNRCRFYPSCSNYSKEALQKHGVLKGLWLTVRRLCRCHPWHPGGIDFP
jgi:putative membrane protein insertion efficiency factor